MAMESHYVGSIENVPRTQQYKRIRHDPRCSKFFMWHCLMVCCSADDATGQGNMWTSDQIAKWLKETQSSPSAQWPVIQARMKQIALYTLIGAQDKIDGRSRSFELFG
jgi:hypothetical protein